MEEVKLNRLLKLTVYSSLFIQITTAIFDIYAQSLRTVAYVAIVKKMLRLELFVQFIEGAFYSWYASSFSSVKNITPTRYYDWIITTPTMLFTICLYLNYLGERDNQPSNELRNITETNTNRYAGTPENVVRRSYTGDSGERSSSEFDELYSLEVNRVSTGPSLEIPERSQYKNSVRSVNDATLFGYLHENIAIFIPIFLLNWMMLLFGYLGETGVMNNKLAVFCGFMPFITFFAIIYFYFAKYSSNTGKMLYWAFFAIWSLYGVAALSSYYWKNISYNILDLCSKNFFGIILGYTLLSNAV